MPPKKKQAEVREETVGDDLDTEFSVSSPLSSASSASTAAAPLMSAHQLQLILESNNKAMAALIASLPTPPAVPTPFASFTPKGTTIKIPKWTDEETPSEYLEKFETAVVHNGVDMGQWGKMLRVYLSGKAQAAYRQIKAETLADYEAVKECLLQSLGDTPEEADRQWWTIKRRSGEQIGAFCLRLSSTGIRRFCGLETREEIVQKVLLSRFMFLLSPEAYDCVSAKDPKSAQEAAKMVQDFEGRESFSRNHLTSRPKGDFRPSYQHYKRESSSTNGSQGGSANNEGSGSKRPSSPKRGSQSSSGQTNGSQSSGNQGRQDRSSYKDRKPIVCYGCGEPGHIRPNCPGKTRRVKDNSVKKDPLVEGWLAGISVKDMVVDTGARKTIVRSEFVPAAAYTGGTTWLDTWKGGEVSEHRVANVKIKVGSVEANCEVAVDDRIEAPAYLGYDLAPPLKSELLLILVEQAAD